MTRATLPCLVACLLLSAGCVSQKAEPPISVATVDLGANDGDKKATEVSEAFDEPATVWSIAGLGSDEPSHGIFDHADVEDVLRASIDAPNGSYGHGGLGLRGTGQGGGGTAEGIGLGSVGGAGGTGYGSGSGFAGSKGSSSRVKAEATSISGSLAPEVILRIVRQNFSALRVCYERALLKEPTLTGKVVVLFTIAGDGRVSKTGVSGDMPSKEVNECVEKTFGRMQFPEPEGKKVVTVTYPLVFSPN